ncbi:hypothetical protein SAMN05428977_10492 [Nitrosomonas sp. Nm166]|nr:hypothetical protein SAMN05428977_10492 [Nitrosomonas sp. Nm166]
MIDSDWEWEFINGSYVKAYNHNAGATGQEAQAHREMPYRLVSAFVGKIPLRDSSGIWQWPPV